MVIYLFIFSFKAALAAYGSFQARVTLELQLQVYATATAMADLSHICDICCSLQQRRILNPWSEARDWTRILMEIMLGS